MGEILVGRLSPQSSGYGLGVITPFSGLSQVSSNNLGFSNDLVSQLQQVQGLNLSQIQVATLLTTISLDRLEGLKEKGVQAVVAEIAPKLQVKEGAVTTVDIVDSLKSISLPQKEVVMVDAPLAVGGQVSTDELAPEGILAKGKPLVVNQGTEDEPVMVAKLNIDQINPGVEVAEQKPIVIETEVRTLTKAEIKMLRANGNVGNLDRVYIPVNMKPSEVKELFSQIKGNIILGDVVLYPFGGNIVIKNSVLNKVVISGKISIVRSDLENVKLATEGGIIRKSVVLGVKMEGTVDVYQSVLINSEVSDQATIGNSLILFAEVESRANVTRSQIVGTDQKPVWVGALTNTYFFHLLGSTMQSKVLEALEASGPALGFFRTNLRKLVGGKAVLVYETGADSKVFKAKLKIKETEYHTLTLAEVTALRQKGIVIANNTKIVVPKGVSIDTLALMIEPGVVLSDKIYMLGNPETIHVEKGTVLDNVMLKGNVKVQASSIIADSVLADSVVEGGTVRDSYLDKTRVETGAVVLRSTIINTKELTVGEY